MAATATIRELRNQFPKVKKLVESEGEVIVTDHGTPKYRLTPYASAESGKRPAPKDYMARLRRHQRRPISAASARALHNANRGTR
jgi:prevent-host-death family protein